jgi:hypothetical protein
MQSCLCPVCVGRVVLCVSRGARKQAFGSAELLAGPTPDSKRAAMAAAEEATAARMVEEWMAWLEQLG